MNTNPNTETATNRKPKKFPARRVARKIAKRRRQFWTPERVVKFIDLSVLILTEFREAIKNRKGGKKIEDQNPS